MITINSFRYLKDTWRLPTADECAALFNRVTDGQYANSGGWSWDATTKSATHPNGVAFPASGYRDGLDGDLINVDIEGRYWSATLVGGANYGKRLYFKSSFVMTHNSDGHQFGCSVRCVRD